MAYPVIATVAASATPADATSHVCALPASISVGDLLLAVVITASGRLAEHVADSGGASGWVKQLSAGIEKDHTRGMDPGPCTSASAAWRALTIIVQPLVTDEAAEAAAKIAQRAAEFGV